MKYWMSFVYVNKEIHHHKSPGLKFFSILQLQVGDVLVLGVPFNTSVHLTICNVERPLHAMAMMPKTDEVIP